MRTRKYETGPKWKGGDGLWHYVTPFLEAEVYDSCAITGAATKDRFQWSVRPRGRGWRWALFGTNMIMGNRSTVELAQKAALAMAEAISLLGPSAPKAKR